MAADDQIDVKITASPQGFVAGMNTAQQALNNGTAAMKSSASGMVQQMRTTMQNMQQSARSGMNGVQSSIANAMSHVKASVASMKNTIGAAGIAVVGVFGTSASAAIEYQKALAGLSRTSGMTIAASSELAFAASQVGMSTADLTKNIGFLSRSLASLERDTDNAGNIFNRFGINVHDANGALLPTNEILGAVADRFQRMPDGVEKTALAMSVFGREGRAMIPLLNQGSAGLQKMGEKAKSLGLVFENVSALKSYVAAQRQWDATLKSLQIQIGNSVLPTLTAFSKGITSLLQAFNRIDPDTRSAIITTTSLAAAVAALTLGWGAAAAAIAAFGGPFARIGVMMTSMPNVVGACTSGIKTFVVGLTNGTIGLTKYVLSGQLFTAIHGKMTAAMAAARAGLVATRSTVVAVSLAFQLGGVRAILSYCTSLISMRSVIAVGRAALLGFYATATAGIAVVVALAAVWASGFTDIKEATAGTCDGLIYGLNNFADGVGEICSGIGQMFTSLALTIGRALVGDFSGAAEAAKGMLQGIKSVGAGFFDSVRGIGQAVYGVASDPEGALSFAKAAGGSLWGSLKGAMGFGGEDVPLDMGTDTGGFDPIGGGGDEKGGAGADGETSSAYEAAKKLYEQQMQLAEYTAAEKEALYKRYLENVTKSEQEAMDYRIGLYALEKESFTERLKEREVDLENAHIRGKVSEQTYQAELAGIKRSSLDAEVEFRARAVMEANRLTEEEKEKQLAAYKEKIEATSWYKSALTEVLNAEKKLAEYELTIQNKILEYQRIRSLDSISLEEKRLEGLYNAGAMTQEALLVRQREFEEQRYNIQRTAAQKELADNAVDIGKMTAAYEAYASARTALDKEIHLNEMLLSSKNEEATIAALKSLEELYAQHAEKLLRIQQKQRDKEISIIKGVRDTLADEMSAIMQDVAKGSTSVLEGIRSLISSTMSSILKQITNRLSENIVQKAFANILQKKSAPDMTAVTAEQTTQAARTAAAQAGAMQRTMIEQTSGAMQVAATTEKATTQIGVETAKDETIVASSSAAGQASVASIQASITAMLQMLPIMLVLSALTGLFGGGKSSKTEKTGSGINLGRNPDSYYKTPRLTGVPSFDVGSWRLPADTLAMVHKDEMIVPAAGGQADGVRSLLSAGGTRQVPQINLTYSAVHTGRTDADVRREMRENAKYMVKVLNSEYRKFNRGNLKG